MAAKTISRPYKLEAKGDHLTRDDLATWKQVLLGHIRQNPRWLQFLPTSETHSTWKSTDEDELNGFDEAINAVIISECQKVKSLPLQFSLAVGSRGSHNRKRFALVAAGNHCH